MARYNTPGLTRGEWLIAQAVIHACVCANATDSATDAEKELSPESRERIIAEVLAVTSPWQRASLLALCPAPA